MQATNLYNRPSTATLVNNSSSVIKWGNLDHGIAVDVDVTALSATNPTVTIYVDRIGADGVAYNLYASSAITQAGQLTLNIGPNLNTAALLGASGQIRWAIGGTDTPSATFSVSVVGQ